MARNNIGVGLIVCGLLVEAVCNGVGGGQRRPAPAAPAPQRRLTDENEGDKALENYESNKQGYGWYNPVGWFAGEEKKEQEDDENLPDVE